MDTPLPLSPRTFGGLKRPCLFPSTLRHAHAQHLDDGDHQEGGGVHLTDLPLDLLHHVLAMVDGNSVLNLSSTSHALRHARACITAVSFHGPHRPTTLFTHMPGLTSISWAVRPEGAGLDLSCLSPLTRLASLSVTVENDQPPTGSAEPPPLPPPPLALAEAPAAAEAPAVVIAMEEEVDGEAVQELEQEQGMEQVVEEDEDAAAPATMTTTLACLEEMYLLLVNVSHTRGLEPALNRGYFPRLRLLRILFTDYGADVSVDSWLLPFLSNHTGGQLQELDICVAGSQLPKLLTALEGGICPELRRLRLRLSGPVPLERTVDIIASPRSRLLRLEVAHLSIDPYENDSFDELLSQSLWGGDDVYRQQAASLLLGEVLLSSFTLLVFLPANYIRVATTGALKLLTDPRLIVRKSVILRLLAELVEEAFHASFYDIPTQAAALALAIEEAIESMRSTPATTTASSGSNSNSTSDLAALKVWHAMRQGSLACADPANDPRTRFVSELSTRLVEAGVVGHLLELATSKPWDQAYLTVACLDAIPLAVLQAQGSRSTSTALDFPLVLLHRFIDVGRSPATFRMNEAFVSVITKFLIVTADLSLGQVLVSTLGRQLILMLLNWPAVRLYMLEGIGGDVGMQYTRLLKILLDIDPNLFEEAKRMLLSSNPLPPLICKTTTPASAFLCPLHAAAPRGSLLCRYIITLSRLDREWAPATSPWANTTHLVPSALLFQDGVQPSPLLTRFLQTESDHAACGALLMRGVPTGADNSLYYQELAAAINILGRSCRPARNQVVSHWGKDRVTTCVFNTLTCVYFTYPSSIVAISDFLRYVVSSAGDIYEFATSQDHDPQPPRVPVTRGPLYRRPPYRRKELVVQGLGSLMHRLGDEGCAMFLKMLLTCPSGDALLTMVLTFLESGDCPRHEVMSVMNPLRAGINLLRQQLQQQSAALAEAAAEAANRGGGEAAAGGEMVVATASAPAHPASALELAPSE